MKLLLLSLCTVLCTTAKTSTTPNTNTKSTTPNKSPHTKKPIKLKKLTNSIKNSREQAALAITSIKQEETTETWESIIQSLVQHNAKIKQAYYLFNGACMKSNLSFANLALPDSIYLNFTSRTTSTTADQLFGENNIELSISKDLGFYTLTTSELRSQAAIVEGLKYKVAIIEELKELLPYIILIIQSSKLLATHEQNVSSLKKSLASTQARMGSVGLTSYTDLTNAQARYQSGLSDLMELKNQIEEAHTYFKLRVGRPIRSDLSQLTKFKSTLAININKSPILQRFLAEYKQSRTAEFESHMRFLPSLKINYRQGMKSSNPSNSNIIEASISCPLYDHQIVDRAFDSHTQSSAALQQYKHSKDSLTYRHQTFNNKTQSQMKQLDAMQKALTAATKYANAEVRKFDAGITGSYLDTSAVLSPEAMLLALEKLHGTTLKHLELIKQIYDHRLRYMLDFGVLTNLTYSKKPSRLTITAIK